jgi:cobaltochelatase CobT
MQPDYLAYTTKFDREIRANDLDSVLGPLGFKDRAAVDEAWRELQTGLLPWRTRQHIVAANASTRLRELLTNEERADTAVTLLLDQSGSMRGQKMLFAAATTDIVQEFLVTLASLARCWVSRPRRGAVDALAADGSGVSGHVIRVA